MPCLLLHCRLTPLTAHLCYLSHLLRPEVKTPLHSSQRELCGVYLRTAGGDEQPGSYQLAGRISTEKRRRVQECPSPHPGYPIDCGVFSACNLRHVSALCARRTKHGCTSSERTATMFCWPGLADLVFAPSRKRLPGRCRWSLRTCTLGQQLDNGDLVFAARRPAAGRSPPGSSS